MSLRFMRATRARSPARRRTSAPRSAAGQTSGGSWSGHLAGWTASVRRGLPVATKACRCGHRLVTKTRPMRPRSFTRRRQTRRSRGMMRIGLPRRAVALVRLVAPAGPAGAGAAREQLEIGPGAACLDDGVLFVGLARMLALAGGEKIHLPTARRKRARIPALDAEQDQFGHVAEVEADAAPVGAAVLAHLVPDEVGLVGEAPRLHHGKTFRQQGVRAPQIKVRYRRRDLPHRQRHDLIETERAIARQTPVLGRDLAGLVGELPGRVRQDGREAPLTCESEEIGGHAHAVVRQSDSGERTMAPSGEHPQVPGAASSTSLFASSESWARIIAARPHTGREDLSWQKVKCAAPRKRRNPRPTTTRNARAAPPRRPRRSPASARPSRAQIPTARSKKRGPARGLSAVLAVPGRPGRTRFSGCRPASCCRPSCCHPRCCRPSYCPVPGSTRSRPTSRWSSGTCCRSAGSWTRSRSSTGSTRPAARCWWTRRWWCAWSYRC